MNLIDLLTAVCSWKHPTDSGLVLLLPALRLAMWWLEQGHTVVPLDYLIQSFAKGFYILLFLGTGLGITAWLFASLIIFNLFEAMFGDESYLGWFWLAEILRWATFCFVEELWKALFVRWDRLKRQEEVGVRNKEYFLPFQEPSLTTSSSYWMIGDDSGACYIRRSSIVGIRYKPVPRLRAASDGNTRE